MRSKFNSLGTSFAYENLTQIFDNFNGLVQARVEGKTFDREGNSRESSLLSERLLTANVWIVER